MDTTLLLLSPFFFLNPTLIKIALFNLPHTQSFEHQICFISSSILLRCCSSSPFSDTNHLASFIFRHKGNGPQMVPNKFQPVVSFLSTTATELSLRLTGRDLWNL